jgi:hypothetical protein
VFAELTAGCSRALTSLRKARRATKPIATGPNRQSAISLGQPRRRERRRDYHKIASSPKRDCCNSIIYPAPALAAVTSNSLSFRLLSCSILHQPMTTCGIVSEAIAKTRHVPSIGLGPRRPRISSQRATRSYAYRLPSASTLGCRASKSICACPS